MKVKDCKPGQFYYETYDYCSPETAEDLSEYTISKAPNLYCILVNGEPACVRMDDATRDGERNIYFYQGDNEVFEDYEHAIRAAYESERDWYRRGKMLVDWLETHLPGAGE